MSCRLPGAPSPAAYWELLREGREAIVDTPSERWELYGLAGPDESTRGLRRGGFLDDVDRFDAGFFGISPREAAAMDPQQRLARAGLGGPGGRRYRARRRCAAARTGVFVGAICERLRRPAATGRRRPSTPHTFTGTAPQHHRQPVSYVLGLRGPSLTVDTGQSSSLVAVHLACESLRAGESTHRARRRRQPQPRRRERRRASAGSARSRRTAAATPSTPAPTASCAARAAALVVLKPLAAAAGRRRPSYGVIRGSAVNNDGGGDGLTVPEPAGAAARSCGRPTAAPASSPAEVAVRRAARHRHPLGDPIEAAALGAALGRTPDAARRCWSAR